MVSLTEVQASNSRIASVLPPGLVAVFVGATSGIGETSFKQFAKHACRPRIYFIGRSQASADRIKAECKALNPEGEYIFIKADTSLIHTVDDVCREIKSKEKAINLLFLCAGTLLMFTETSEGLHYAASLAAYSRTRFIVNLLPLLQQATVLRRVISVLSAGKEGPVDAHDLQGRKLPLRLQMSQGASLVSMTMEALAKSAPDVTFIHSFPGMVKTNLVRGGEGAVMYIMSLIFKITGPFRSGYVPIQECGERYLFLATSAKYPMGVIGGTVLGVPLAEGLEVAKGVDGHPGSGAYSIYWNGESTGSKVEEVLAKFRKEGMIEKVWKDTQEEFVRITGCEAA